jgi:hypothetical protein
MYGLLIFLRVAGLSIVAVGEWLEEIRRTSNKRHLMRAAYLYIPVLRSDL